MICMPCFAVLSRTTCKRKAQVHVHVQINFRGQICTASLLDRIHSGDAHRPPLGGHDWVLQRHLQRLESMGCACVRVCVCVRACVCVCTRHIYKHDTNTLTLQCHRFPAHAAACVPPNNTSLAPNQATWHGIQPQPCKQNARAYSSWQQRMAMLMCLPIPDCSHVSQLLSSLMKSEHRTTMRVFYFFG